MRRSYNSFQAMSMPHKGETNNEPSQTVPDQAISAPELLRRFATGQPLGFKNVTPVYDDDEGYEIPEFYKLSKLDRLHFLQNNSEELKDNLNLYKREEQQKQDALRRQQEKDESQKEQQQPRTQDADDDAT